MGNQYLQEATEIIRKQQGPRGPVWMCGEQLLEMIAPDEEAAKAMAETASSDAEKERLTGEIEDLRRKLAMADKDVTAAQLYFYQWQAAFNQLTQAISHIKDEDKAGKFCAAIRAQLAAWGKAMEETA